MSVKTNQVYSRRDDMSPENKLHVMIQPDGDAIVTITMIDIDEGTRNFSRASVEFTFPGGGGGRSPHTRKALVSLAEAIEKDNKENPIPD